MKEYTEKQVVMISIIQKNSLKILKSYNINVSQFIRQAIKEKISREWKEIKQPKEEETPF